MPITFDTAASSTFEAISRALGWAAVVVIAALAFVFAAAAAVVAGLMILGAAVALRLAPKPARVRRPETLDARRTPAGWVVEIGSRR
jgi:hypothetical protein